MFYLKNLLSSVGVPQLAVAFISVLALQGCGQPSSERTSGAAPVPRTPQVAPSPEANIYVDEAMLAKPYAIIGGAVENIGSQRLEKLSVEIELRRREDGVLESRQVSVEPADLEPGKQGKFSLKVLSEEWSGSRVVRLRSGSRPQTEVAFRPQPGAKRPPEKVKGNVIIVKTPSQKKANGSDFINTPDTPYSVP